MSTHEKRIGIVVVAYNAESTLAATLHRIPEDFRRRISEVIVLDDASADGTSRCAKEWADGVLDHTTLVVTHTKNLGYGGNQKAAYQMAHERGLDIVVLLHGDGQYAPEYLPEMVEPLLSGEAEAVFGSRMMTPGAAKRGGMPLYKRLGNRVLTRMENRMLGTSLTEFHSGYRAYDVAALDQIPYVHNSDGFDFDTQIIVQLADAGKRIVEIPIPTFYGEEICYVNGMKYAWDVTKDVLEYRMAKVGLGTSEWVPGNPEYALKEGEGSSHTVLLEMLAAMPPSRVLDVGCSSGLLSEQVRKLGHYVVGMEMTELPGVRDRVDEFHLADLAAGDFSAVGLGYDVVLLGDTIEHLPRPLDIVRKATFVLRPGGQILLSVPNFGHWYPRGRTMTGTFGYDRRGVLDESHLRFFTRRTLHRLVQRAGLDVLEERHTGLPLPATDGARPSALGRVDAFLVRSRPQLFAYQFVLRATPHVEWAEVTVHEPGGTTSQIVELDQGDATPWPIPLS